MNAITDIGLFYIPSFYNCDWMRITSPCYQLQREYVAESYINSHIHA